jgi:hypothetical protein
MRLQQKVVCLSQTLHSQKYLSNIGLGYVHETWLLSSIPQCVYVFSQPNRFVVECMDMRHEIEFED